LSGEHCSHFGNKDKFISEFSMNSFDKLLGLFGKWDLGDKFYVKNYIFFIVKCFNLGLGYFL